MKRTMLNVVFDMDGVIFDTERTLLDCWIDTAEKYDIDKELIRNTYIKCIGTNRNQTTEIYKNAFLNILGEEKLWSIWDESVALHKERYSDGILPLKSGVKEILEFLKANGIPAGIASSSKKPTIEQLIGKAGLSDYFVGSVGGDSVKISKPNPEIYLLACSEFGFEPAGTFAIEDSFNGIKAASAAGMRPIMVPDIVQPDDEIKQLSETVRKDLFETMNYLTSILENDK